MVVIETPDGSQSRYRLVPSPGGWRLARRNVSYDLMTMVQSGWRILVAESDRDRSHLKRVFRQLQPAQGWSDDPWDAALGALGR